MSYMDIFILGWIVNFFIIIIQSAVVLGLSFKADPVKRLKALDDIKAYLDTKSSWMYTKSLIPFINVPRALYTWYILHMVDYDFVDFTYTVIDIDRKHGL